MVVVRNLARGLLIAGLAITQSTAAQRKQPVIPPPVVVTPPPLMPRFQSTNEQFGDWTIYPVGKGAWATTKNASGSAFGVVCTGDCTTFFNLQTTCVESHEYPALINSSAGSFTVQLKCKIWEKRYLLTMPLNDTLIDSLSIGGELGVALPLESGKFNVGRFSMTGGLRAATRALDIAKIRGSADDSKALKDYSL